MACPRGTSGCNRDDCSPAPGRSCYGPDAPRHVDMEDALACALYQDDLSRQRALSVFLLIVGVFALWIGLLALVVAFTT